jgi:histidinol-phosphate phosphatase family protein
MKPALFLDRDGVLNVYLPGDYVKFPDELILLPGVGAAVARVNAAGIPVFIISNQQGVAKGVMSPEDLAAVEQRLRNGLQEANATIDRTYYCLAHDSEKSEDRKPRPGMILRAAQEFDLDLSRSVFIGDTETDAAAARAAGVGRFILVLTGKHTYREAAQNPGYFPTPPDYVASNLAEAVDWSLAHLSPSD